MARSGVSRRGEPALLTALLQGKTVPEAAQAAGLSPRTVTRRLADPAFVRELQAARQRALNRAVTLLTEGAVLGAAQLRWLCANASQEHVKLAASRSILEYAFKGVETVDLLERLEALERRAGNGTPLGGWRNGR